MSNFIETLTIEQMESIFDRNMEGGESKMALGREFGCSPRTIGRIIEKVRAMDSDVEEEPEYHEERYQVVANTFVIFVADKETGDCVNISNGDDRFEKFFSRITENQASLQEIASEILVEGDIARAIEAFSNGSIRVDPENMTVSYVDKHDNEYELKKSLPKRILDKVMNDESIDGLCRFAEKLYSNPERKVVDELFDFLEAGEIEITDEGDVLCYKKVTHDYKDCHTRKIDNSVGQSPEMPRAMVDNDSNQTCSRGYHVCSKAYLPHFGGERVMLCKVNPADFVSIPKDYYSIDGVGNVKAKARVCKYEVIDEIY